MYKRLVEVEDDVGACGLSCAVRCRLKVLTFAFDFVLMILLLFLWDLLHVGMRCDDQTSVESRSRPIGRTLRSEMSLAAIPYALPDGSNSDSFLMKRAGCSGG